MMMIVTIVALVSWRLKRSEQALSTSVVSPYVQGVNLILGVEHTRD